ncbi:Rhomboid family protein [Thermodesulfatator indicus DSM 15286]|uniref:Rhomboid family protein n=1 Tax=Thermodesulfatator indicus (strain DSM 15286 / JCM 11887 / CIR29812) TaxID=667014 RepID=F8AAJ9_THEID|nr:rhomboid family intramembrane serine protease [Thermodesulfatator indicus]AEH45424.1 Rhomboid family protein [Thermodesulfatator indicus DSM 15286]
MIPIQDIVPRKTFPIVTVSLIALNSLIFILMLNLPAQVREAIVINFGVVPARITQFGLGDAGVALQNVISLFTAMFLHGGWIHLFGNMWTLWIFGDNVEDRMGHRRFLVFYLLCGIAATLVHVWLHPDSTIPMIGASGAISGVLGAYYGLFPLARVIVMIPIFFFPFFFEMPAVLYIGWWYLLQLFSGTLSILHGKIVGGVAWWAHVGGFVVGLLLHRLFCVGENCFPDEVRPWGVSYNLGEKINR